MSGGAPSSNETNPRGQKRKDDDDEEHTANRQSYPFRCSWDKPQQSTAGQQSTVDEDSLDGVDEDSLDAFFTRYPKLPEGREFHPDDITEGRRYNEYEVHPYMRYTPTNTVTTQPRQLMRPMQTPQLVRPRQPMQPPQPTQPMHRRQPMQPPQPAQPMHRRQPMQPMQNAGFATLNKTQSKPPPHFSSFNHASQYPPNWSAPGRQYANQHAAPPNNQPGTSRSHFAPMQNTGFATLNKTQSKPPPHFSSFNHASQYPPNWSAPGRQYANQHAAPPNNQPGTSRSHFAPMQNTGFATLNKTQSKPPPHFSSFNHASQYPPNLSAPGRQHANQNAPPNNQPGTSRSHFAPPPPHFVPQPSPMLFAQQPTKAPEADPTNDTEQFTEVFKSGTLCGRKVVVTLGELRRRMGSPERQGWDMLARLTRHLYKGVFQKKMVEYGFDWDKNVAQSADSTIAMLLEEDALTLGKDFNRLITGELLSSILSSIASVNNRGMEIAKEAHRILYLLALARAYLRNPDSQPVKDAHASRKFSLFTHGFGPLVAVAVIDSLVQVIEVIKIRPFPDQRDLAPLNPAPMSDNDATTASTPTPNKGGNGASVSAVDASLLHRQKDDHFPICKSRPRIGYDVPLIEMTRGEIRRRANGPEKLNPSLFLKFIRESKKGGSDLREKLEEIGMTPKSYSSHKARELSSWTWIFEEESTAIAKETGSALVRLPPSQAMVQAALEFPAAAALLKDIAVSISDAMRRVGESPSQPRVETQADLRILRFALLTHHFGHTFYASVMNWLQLDVCRN